MEVRKTLWEMITGTKLSRGGPTGLDTVKRRSCTTTDPEWLHVEDMAEKNGMSTASYVRLLIIKDLKDGGMSVQKEKNKIKRSDDVKIA